MGSAGVVCEQTFLGHDPRVRQLLEMVRLVAPSDAPVLITGESGTGKELLAALIHRLSRRLGAPYVAVNCGAIAANLEESELFGHVAGAFTGAVARKQGKLEAADGGTLFLDEVAEMSPAVQVKLLRVLAGGEFSPVGMAATRRCDVRVVAATNQDLAGKIGSGRFRPELYYRLNVVRLEVPPLRERPGDVLPLVHHFVRVYAARYRRNEPRLSREFEERVLRYAFPGNVRELENVVHRALVLCRGDELGCELLPAEVLASQAPAPGPQAGTEPGGEAGDFHAAKQQAVEAFEREYLTRVLRQCAGIVSRAAGRVGLSERNFHEKLNRYGIDGRSFRPS